MLNASRFAIMATANSEAIGKNLKKKDVGQESRAGSEGSRNHEMGESKTGDFLCAKGKLQKLTPIERDDGSKVRKKAPLERARRMQKCGGCKEEEGAD